MREVPAIVLARHGHLPEYTKVQIDEPGPREVCVRMVASGICHTDLAAVRDARMCPVLLGHEGAGIVEQVGAQVTQVRAGEHVVINWQPKCRRCRRCLAGRQDLCENIQGTDGPRVHWHGSPLAVLLQAGTFCPYVIVPEQGAVPLRADVPLELAALLGCAVATGIGAALFTARVQPAEDVVVIGTGGVGLHVVRGAALAQARRVIAIDISSAHLELASKYGATDTLNAREVHAVAAVKELTGGRGVEHVFEVVGSPERMLEGIEMLSRGGVLTLVGAAARDATLPFFPRRFMSQQQTIQGCIYGNIQPELHLSMFADWLSKGTLPLAELPLEYIRLEDIPAVFARRESGQALRTIVRFKEDR